MRSIAGSKDDFILPWGEEEPQKGALKSLNLNTKANRGFHSHKLNWGQKNKNKKTL